MAFFSAINIVAPVAGIFAGISNLSFFIIGRACIETLLFGTNPLLSTVYHSSHLFASAYWLTRWQWTKMVMPLVAMAVFCLHTQGSIGYALLWCIPLACVYIKGDFAKALGATFTAHAFGSVLFLFTHDVTLNWVALIPVALTERFIFASGIFICYKLGIYLKNLQLVTHKQKA